MSTDLGLREFDSVTWHHLGPLAGYLWIGFSHRETGGQEEREVSLVSLCGDNYASAYCLLLQGSSPH